MSLSNWNETADSSTSFELYALGAYSDVNGSAERNTDTADAAAVFYVKLSDMRAVFQFQRGTSSDASLNDAIFDASSDIRYYVFRKYWPTALSLNPSHAMLDRNESTGMLTPGGAGTGTYSADKSLVKHDFLRYIALNLFNTINGVDFFRNEDDLRENLAYYGEVARVGIMSVLDTLGTMSANSVMAVDSSGNRYSTNEDTTVTNISRELMRQIAVSAPGRLGAIDAEGGDGGVIQSVPLSENDTLNFKVVMEASPGQNALTNVAAIPARTYNIKLIMKSVVGVSGDGGAYTNTPVSDSASFPNGYPYAINVYDISASNASVAPSVYANGSPPVPIPLIRYGYQGWYYTNSDAWVNTSPTVRNKINWYILPNSTTSTVGDLRYIRLNLHVFSRVSTPFLTVYTQATGVDDAGGWYKSKRVYVVANAAAAALSDNTNYCFYINWNGYSVAPFTVAHTNVALSLTTVEGDAVGAFGSGEVLFAYSIGTDSGAARGNVEFILSGAVVGEGGGGGTEKEYGYIPV
jgi:hypothetical protein